MTLPGRDVLDHLSEGYTLSDGQSWPQLDAMLTISGGRVVNSAHELWKRAAHWMYRHPEEPCAPQTEQLFRLDVQTCIAEDKTRELNRLLRVWTRYGTYAPSSDDQRCIANRLVDTDGIQFLQYAPNAVEWVSARQRKQWLDTAHKEVQRRPTATPESMHVYFHGDVAMLNPNHKKQANRERMGLMEDYPIGFMQARVVHQSHPEPDAWVAALMDLAWGIAKEPGPDDLWTNAASNIEHLDAMLDSMSWDTCTPAHATCLVTAALMERDDNLLMMNIAAWDQRCPDLWKRTKDMLPVIESLHNIPSGPHDSAVAANLLAPLVLESLLNVKRDACTGVTIDSGLFFCSENRSTL